MRRGIEEGFEKDGMYFIYVGLGRVLENFGYMNEKYSKKEKKWRKYEGWEREKGKDKKDWYCYRKSNIRSDDDIV